MITKTHFLSIWCMGITLLGYTQHNNTLKTQLQLLQETPEARFPLDSSGYSKIKSAKLYSKHGDTDVFNFTSKNIHLIDFNNDGIKDIIYQENRLHQATVLLANNGNDFIEIWNGPGVFIDLKQGKETTVYVLSNAIGCFPYKMLYELKITNDNVIISHVLRHHFDTKLEGLRSTLEQKKLSGVLRTQPLIDNKEMIDACTGSAKIGNQLKIIKNQTVTILKEQGNWLLVLHQVMDNSIISWIKK